MQALKELVLLKSKRDGFLKERPFKQGFQLSLLVDYNISELHVLSI
jgi:hypothetical protein